MRSAIALVGLLSTVLAVGAAEAPAKRAGFAWQAASLIAIQDRGRFKPLETFAEESVLFVTGKRSWNKMCPIEVLFGWLVAFDREWEDHAFIRIDHTGLKQAIGLDVSRKYFTPEEARNAPGLPALVRDAMAKEQRKERASDIEKRALQLQSQRGLLDAIASGQALTILPNPSGGTEPWLALAALAERSGVPYSAPQIESLAVAMRGVLDSFMAKDAGAWNDASLKLAGLLRDDLGRGVYPDASSLSREAHYNRLRPFRWAWVLYATAFVLFLVAIAGARVWARPAALASLGLGFGLHIYGFILRCLIAGRPPVTNMYESVIWVAWGCILFSLVIWAKYRSLAIPAAASVFATVALVLADSLPLVLDPNIHPLEPVLRSNFWLTIHVLTITLSYAAFALSLCLGNVVLGGFLLRPTDTDTIQTMSLYMYRAIQIGVVLLAAGTILGGVWADYSWGRFWGWDPKEVWALIALLLYLAVLHGRFAGWLKGFGFVTGTVMAFLGVLMAWYGVNFVLGVGLHSYGFGTGGMGWVLLYVGLQVGFIAAAGVRFRKAHQGKHLSTAIFPKGT